jgi:[calcium/calmodulin-dependent protein kinase] kinase
MPPEACDYEITNFSGILADVWALGVTMYCLTFNILPFSGGNEYLIMENIRTSPVEFPNQIAERPLSNDFMKVLQALMQKDASQRMTLD